jgi:hypothetical protein
MPTKEREKKKEENREKRHHKETTELSKEHSSRPEAAPKRSDSYWAQAFSFTAVTVLTRGLPATTLPSQQLL